MSTRHLVDPELRPFLDLMPTVGFSAETLPLIRKARAQQLEAQKAARQPPEDIEVSEHFVPGPAAAPWVRVLVYRPRGAAGPRPAYLHMHGGGFVTGKPESFADFNERFARELGCLVVSVDYRKAPETRFPGALEDCYAALRWLHAEAEALGVDPRRVCIGGESAGGGLAAGLALLARDRGEIPVAFQLLIYPVLDDRTCVREGLNPQVGEFVWTLDSNRFAWTCLLGRAPGGADVSPYAAPARAEDLRGLPPAYVSVGSLDLFLDENLAYASRLLHAGVPTELHVYPGAVHGFELAATTAVAQAAMRDRIAALRRVMQTVQA